MFSQTTASEDIQRDRTWMVPLEDYSLILVRGPESEKFLQGQCTCDFSRLTINTDKAKLSDSEQQVFLHGAHCNHKGRMLCSFVAAKINHDTIALRLHQSVEQTALVALKKYATFSKVTLTAANDLGIFGVCGPEAEALCASLLSVNSEKLPSENRAAQFDGATVLCHSIKQYEVWLTQEKLHDMVPSLNKNSAIENLEVQKTSNLWRLQNIARGIGEVTSNITESLIPQEINFQLVDGISFSKGCYTGQEVVARMHYRAHLKKHMYRGILPVTTPPNVGASLFESEEVAQSDAPKIRGSIVTVARSDEHHCEFLALCDDNLINLPRSVVEGNLSAEIQWLTLPYAIS